MFGDTSGWGDRGTGLPVADRGAQGQPRPLPPQGGYVVSQARFTPMDFELFLNSNRDPTPEMRRSQEYYYWYNSKVPRDPRAPPPLPSIEVQETLNNLESPWEEEATTGLRVTGGGNPAPRRGPPGLELNAKNLEKAHEEIVNPYELRLIDTMLSPNSQMYAAYAPSPLVHATPNTFNAYLQQRQRGEAGVDGAALYNPPQQQQQPPVRGGRSIAAQQYYTQEPMHFSVHPSQQQTFYNPNVVNPQYGMYDNNPRGNNYDDGGRGGRGGRGRGGRGRGGRGRGAMPDQRFNPGSEKMQQFHAEVAMHGDSSTWRLGDIRGHVVEFAKDQEGSRFIQRALDNALPAEINTLFYEVFDSPLDLVTDIFGNYVLQKILEKGNTEQLTYAATRLRGQVVNLTLQTYGCRVIQKCIEVMPPEGLDVILSELQGNVAKCIQDQNGNHVVQRCVEVIPQRCGFIISAFEGRVMELATHAYGCRVIQCIMEHCPEQEETIFSELLKGVEMLVKDQYGNYVIQHVLQHAKDPNKKERIFEALKDHFYELSRQKFASNVLEKMFAFGTPEHKELIVQSLCNGYNGGAQVEEVSFVRSKDTTVAKANESVESRGAEARENHKEKYRKEKEAAIYVVDSVEVKPKKTTPSLLCMMMNDQYGNYVAQRVLDNSDVAQFSRLIDNIQKFVVPIRSYEFGRPVVQRLARRHLILVPDGHE